jgi:putative drug exporter of the RND superfamily
MPLVGRLARTYAFVVVGMRYLVLFGWLGAVAFAALYLPSLSAAGGVADLVPNGSAALRAEADATRLFRVPMSAPVAVVQHSRARMPLAVQEKAARSGPIPARYEQGQIIARYLPWVEAATVAAIFLIVGWYFWSFGAPLATLLCTGISYLVAVHLVAWATQRMGVTIPPDLEPVLVVLLLGVGTDYCVFFLSGMRARLAEGVPRLAAARLTTAEYTPIIVAAGFVAAAGTAALVVARLQLLRAFGPGLALTVLTAMVVSITLAPALIAIFGGLLFRPGPVRLRRAALGREGTSLREPARSPGWLPGGRSLAEFGARFAATGPVALLIVLACLAGLLIAALGLPGLRLGSPLIRELPASAEAARAESAAARGFVAGILAPTDVLIFRPGVTAHATALRRMELSLRHQPGVAGVIGPADIPQVARRAGLMLASAGNAARFVVIERTDPLGPVAVARVRGLERALPALARSAGLTHARFEVGGETALTAEAIGATTSDMGRIAVAVLIVTFVLLAFFLRALLAPLYLLAASVLALLAALGITAWIFQGVLGYECLVYFVPFAAGVLLVSLGSDYNIFVVGRIFQEARRLPIRDAVATAAPRASRAITTAGLALAASFAVLAVIPLDQFRELAVAMALGVTIDAFVVRSLMVPALVALFGRANR